MTTKSDRLFLYAGQRRALADLMAGMDEDARWALVLGPNGIGKTTVLQVLLTELRLTDADVVVCDGNRVGEVEALATSLRGQLRLAEPARKRLGQGRPGADILVSRETSARPLALLIDDAQALSPGSLKFLSELAAVSSPESAVCVVLIGTPSLEEPALRAASSLKHMRCRIAPLSASEVRQYVERRLSPEAENLPNFSDDAVPQIAMSTEGIPGAINALLDVVVRRPSARLTNQVSADTVVEAARQIGLDTSSEDEAASDARSVMGADESGDDEDRALRVESRRRWRVLTLWMGAGVLAGLTVYVAPPLVRATHDWLSTPSSEAPVTAQAPAPAPAPGGPRRQAAVSSSAPARPARVTPEVSPARSTPERRLAPALQSEPPAPRPAPPSPEQVSAVIAGARDGRTEDLRRLLTGGVPANVRDAKGVTPLMQAVSHGHVPAAEVLLERGAEINARDRGGITPVMLAVISEQVEALELLLARGADVNARSGTGWTALTFAAWKGDPDLVRLLLNHRANPKVVDKQGWSPLDYAMAQLRSSREPVEPPIGLDLSVVSVEARHSEVIPLLQGDVSR